MLGTRWVAAALVVVAVAGACRATPTLHETAVAIDGASAKTLEFIEGTDTVYADSDVGLAAADRELRRQLSDLFAPAADELELEFSPDPAWLLHSVSGDTVRADAVVTMDDDPDFRLEVAIDLNFDTGYQRWAASAGDVSAENRALSRYPDLLDVPSDLTQLVETIAGDGTVITRGASTGVDRAGLLDRADPERWYVGAPGWAGQELALPLADEEAFWEIFDTDDFLEYPTRSSIDGRDVQRAVISSPAVFQGLRALVGLIRPGEDGIEVVTESRAGVIETIRTSGRIRLPDRSPVRTVVLDFTDRGADLDIPVVDEVYRAPGFATRLGYEPYEWSATVTRRPDSGSPVAGPWSIAGRVGGGGSQPASDSSLTISARAVGALTGGPGQGDTDEIPVDAVIERLGPSYRTRSRGLIPEVIPWTSTSADVDPTVLYEFDPIPHLSNHILANAHQDTSLWVTLKTLPHVPDPQDVPEGWNYGRVTTARIAPAAWQWAAATYREHFANWIELEANTRWLGLTVGADDDGRVRRLLVETEDDDGGFSRWDIAIDDLTTPISPSPSSGEARIGSSPEWTAFVDRFATDLEGDRFDAFFSRARDAIPTVRHDLMPEHLTIVATEGRTSEPAGGKRFDWAPAGSFAVATERIALRNAMELVCLDRPAVPWPTDLDLERVWLSLDDGIPLDDVMIDDGRGPTYVLDIYAYRGPRPNDDPCSWQEWGS